MTALLVGNWKEVRGERFAMRLDLVTVNLKSFKDLSIIVLKKNYVREKKSY